MKLLSHYPSYLRTHGSPVKFPLTGKGETLCSFLKREKRKTWGSTGSQFHLCAQQDHGAESPGNYVKAYGK